MGARESEDLPPVRAPAGVRGSARLVGGPLRTAVPVCCRAVASSAACGSSDTLARRAVHKNATLGAVPERFAESDLDAIDVQAERR